MGTPPANPPGDAGTRIKGGVLITRLSMLRQHGGESCVKAVLERLPPEDREALTGMLLPITWYPVALNMRLDAAIAEVVSPNDKAQAFIKMGRTSADENLRGSHRYFVKPGNPHALLSQAPHIYGLYYTVGRRTYEKTGEKSAVLRTYDAESVTESDCLTVVGWHQKAIEMCGGKDVKVTHPKCRARGAPSCEYLCSWS